MKGKVASKAKKAVDKKVKAYSKSDIESMSLDRLERLSEDGAQSAATRAKAKSALRKTLSDSRKAGKKSLKREGYTPSDDGNSRFKRGGMVGGARYASNRYGCK